MTVSALYGWFARQEAQGEAQRPIPDPDRSVQAADETVWTWSGSEPFEPQTPTPAHHYLSTGCFHGEHAYCQSSVRADGQPKFPGQCKFCDARCICVCHGQ